MSTSLLLDPYAALHQEIRLVLLEGKACARQAVEQEKVRTHRQVGQCLHGHLLQHQERARYGEQLIGQLAADLDLGERMLHDGLALYRVYPIQPTSAELAWR